MMLLYFHLYTKSLLSAEVIHATTGQKNVPSLSSKLKVTFSKVIALDNKKAINMHLILNILYRPELLCNSLLQTYNILLKTKPLIKEKLC